MVVRESRAASAQNRYLRPDASRFIQPDGARFLRPDAARVLRPGASPAGMFATPGLKFRLDQPRVPAGQPGGGRWTDMLVSFLLGLSTTREDVDQEDGEDESEGDDDGDERSEVEDDYGLSIDPVENFRNSFASSKDVPNDGFEDAAPRTLGEDFVGDPQAIEPIPVGGIDKTITNEFGEPYYNPGGHHEMARGVFGKWDLAPETRQVFQGSTTGSLPQGLAAGPDGEFRRHIFDIPHRQYNEAVSELSNKFLEKYEITDPRQLTPDQARELLAEIRNTDDPRIREYNRAMRYISRAFRGRFSRGNQ